MLRTLEKYEILEEIGHGGMATVYRARDTRLDREVAIKVLHPHLQRAEEARSRFEREARSVARLRHPNVLEVYDYSGQDSEESYIASELLTGPTLKRYAEDGGGMPAEIAACFAIQIARALGVAHEHGIIHRDVKPENVLIHENRLVKLTDFGIAQMVDSQSFTATGQILGSPGHMAPEQVEGADCDARTDLFSLATVLYYLAVGRLPFTGRNPHQVLKRIVDGDYPDPLRLEPTVGGELAAILNKALQTDPEARYQSAAELEQDLLDFVRRIGIEEPDATLAEYLADPEQVGATLRQQAVERLTALGEAALAEGDIPTALSRFNRVLALDDGNERVLALIDRIGRRDDRRRRLILGAGVGLGVVGILLGWAGWQMAEGDGAEGAAVASAEAPGAGLADGGGDGATAGEDGGRPDARASGALAARAEDAGPTAQARSDEEASRPRRARARPIGQPVAPAGKRTVRFSPDPRGVQVRIDGESEPSPWFEAVELEPGEHTFEFVGECCETLELTERIPPGRDPYVVRAELQLEPALLYVRSNQAADVVVDVGERRIEGRTNSVIAVGGLEEPQALARVRVTAEGYREYKGRAPLVAGQTKRLAVNLEAAEDSP